MKLLKKLKIVTLAATFASSIGFWAGYAYEFTSVVVGKHLAVLVVSWERTPALLQSEISLALDEDRLDDARLLIRMNQSYGYPHSSDWDRELERKSTFIYAAKRAPKQVYRGVAYGEMASTVSASAAITSDLLGVGDFRDLAIESYKLSKGEEIDKLVAGLAAFGVVTTLAPTIDGGVSLAKAAARQMAKQNAPFRELLLEQVAGAVNYAELSKSLKAADFSTSGAAALSANVKRSLRLDNVAGFFREIGIIAQNSGGVRNSLALINHVSDMDTLKNVRRATQGFGEKTALMVRLGGERMIKVFGKVFQRLLWLAGAIFCALATLMQAFLMYLSLRASNASRVINARSSPAVAER